MTRKFTLLLIFLFAFGCIALAVSKPDFSGEWVMDRTRSFGIPANMSQTMTVKLTGDQMEVETKLSQPGNERIVKDTYVLDNQEHDFSPPVPPTAPPNTPAPKGKRTASWMADNKGIIANEVITAETPKGPVTTNVTKKWTFTGEGELTIAFFVDGPNGSYEAKRIFTKKP